MPYPLGHRAGLSEHRKCQLVVKLTLHVERRASRPAGLGGAWGELSADVLCSIGAKNIKGAYCLLLVMRDSSFDSRAYC